MTAAAKPILANVSQATERHYSVAESAELWKLSPNTVRRMFQSEPGVFAVGEPRPRYGRQRGKVTLRIPQSVLDRVYRRRLLSGKL